MHFMQIITLIFQHAAESHEKSQWCSGKYVGRGKYVELIR